ncbi:MAG: sugar kinase [Nakamurella sp.]
MTDARPQLTAVGEVLVSLQAPAGFDLTSTDTLDVRIAGAEANFAAAFIRAGGDAALCSAVGQDPFGDQVLRRLDGMGIDTSLVHRDAARPTGVMLNQRHTGERQVFYYRAGSAASALTVEQVLNSTGRLVISGVTFAVAADLRNRATDLLDGLRAAGRDLVLDVNLRPRLGHVEAVVRAIRAAARQASMVFVGLDEAGPVFGVDDPAELARLIASDRDADVVVTDGANGSWVGGRHLPAVPTLVVDPVGAGDAFAGTYCALRALGEPPVTAGLVAAQIAARVVSTPGDLDGLPPTAEVFRLLALHRS